MELSEAHQIVMNMKEEENHKTAKLFLAFVQGARPKNKTEMEFREINLDYAWDFLTQIADKSENNENNIIYPGNPFNNATDLDNFVKNKMVDKGIVERKDDPVEYSLNVDTLIDKYSS